MKLGLIKDFSPAVIVDGGAIDLSAVLPYIAALPVRVRMTALIEGWLKYKEVVTRAACELMPQPLERVQLRAPSPRPGKLVCAQLSFREGVPDAVVESAFFLKSPCSVIGPDEMVELSRVNAAVFHHEAELAVIVGSRAKAVSPEEAMQHVFGYTCALGGWHVASRLSDERSGGTSCDDDLQGLCNFHVGARRRRRTRSEPPGIGPDSGRRDRQDCYRAYRRISGERDGSTQTALGKGHRSFGGGLG